MDRDELIEKARAWDEVRRAVDGDYVSPLSYADVADFALNVAAGEWHPINGPEEVANRTAWMIERTSTLWGHEWFCAGESRWAKDPNKTIQFPDQASAEEVWRRMFGKETEELPHTEPSAGDWDYTYSITEHVWLPLHPYSPSGNPTRRDAAEVEG